MLRRTHPYEKDKPSHHWASFRGIKPLLSSHQCKIVRTSGKLSTRRPNEWLCWVSEVSTRPAWVESVSRMISLQFLAKMGPLPYNNVDRWPGWPKENEAQPFSRDERPTVLQEDILFYFILFFWFAKGYFGYRLHEVTIDMFTLINGKCPYL